MSIINIFYDLVYYNSNAISTFRYKLLTYGVNSLCATAIFKGVNHPSI